jgi:hypothetical protein
MVVDRCDEGVALSTSHDEGQGWKQTPISGAVTENMPVTSLAVDGEGTLYVAWTSASDHLPYVTISRDRGASWSRPALVAAPGVNRIDGRTLAIAVDRPGRVGLAYSGSTDNGATYNGYMGESDDARVADPVWWSASVNDPAHPLLRGAPSSLYGDREWFSEVTFGSDGTAWAGFHCVRTDLCPANRVGMVGRLAKAPPGRPATPACSRKLVVRLPHRRGRRFVRVAVWVDGRRRAGRRGRNVRRVVIRTTGRGRHRIKLVATTSRGRRVKIVRRMAACRTI